MDKINVLLNKYIEAAIQHGKATEEGDYKSANKAFKVLKKVYDELKANQDFGVQKLSNLLNHEEEYVRLWASSHTLQVDTEKAKKTLIELTKKTGFLAFNAKMTLEEWEKGNLKF